MDVFDQLHAQQTLDEHIDKFFRDLEVMWGNSEAIYVDPLDTLDVPPAPPPSPTYSSTLPQISHRGPRSPRYRPPAENSYARQIWDSCGFRVGNSGERESTIEQGLLRWANQNQLLFQNNDGKSCITWSHNGTQISGQWSAFRLWFFCACTKT